MAVKMEGVDANSIVLQLVLRLRGGGADAKRKEARKRKFEHLLTHGPHDDDATGTMIEGENAESPVKKQKKKKKLKSLSERPEAPPPAEAQEVLDEQSNVQAPKTKSSEKSQRFIVFIGMHS